MSLEMHVSTLYKDNICMLLAKKIKHYVSTLANRNQFDYRQIICCLA